MNGSIPVLVLIAFHAINSLVLTSQPDSQPLADVLPNGTSSERRGPSNMRNYSYRGGRSTPNNFFTYFLPHFDEDEPPPKHLEEWERDEDEPRPKSLSNLLSGGPLDEREFVVLEHRPYSGRFAERSFRFEEDQYREKRHTDSSSENHDKIHENVVENLTAVHKLPPPSSLIPNGTVRQNLTTPPKNFSFNTVLIHYAHKLTLIEKAEDSLAKLGDPCQQTTVLEPDYCERAAYPNKNKMVCNSVNDTRMPSLKRNTCICKFYKAEPQIDKTTSKMRDTEAKWKQMKVGKLTINDEEVDVCLVPRYGVCNHRIFTGHKDTLGRPIYEVDVCQGHFQCDNTPFYNKFKDGNVIQLNKHCTEKDFIEKFDESVHDEILVCSKPHPRRFTTYDEFKFYCLPKKDRDDALKGYRPSDSISTENIDML